MRIIDTRGKDYYDGVMFSLFNEGDLLFVRDEKTVYTGKKRGRWDWGDWNWGSIIESWPFGDNIASHRGYFERTVKINGRYVTEGRDEQLLFIGFCGRVYPVIRKILSSNFTFGVGDTSIKYEHFYSPRESDSNRIKKMFERYQEPPQIFLDHWQKMMEEQGSPVFVASPTDGTITWNNHLEEYDFPSVINAYEAGKKVYQFLANIPKPEMPIPNIDDVTRAEIHGFNKESFRKPKQKK